MVFVGARPASAEVLQSSIHHRNVCVYKTVVRLYNKYADLQVYRKVKKQTEQNKKPTLGLL